MTPDRVAVPSEFCVIVVNDIDSSLVVPGSSVAYARAPISAVVTTEPSGYFIDCKEIVVSLMEIEAFRLSSCN